MGYSFLDTMATTPANATLPPEAVSIDGMYIEEAISGYQTLYTHGRESIAAELETQAVGVADGGMIRNIRYPSREITVGFQMVAANAADFRDKFNHLNNILSTDEADFVFADEDDKYFTGVPVLDLSQMQVGQNAVVGEWKIYCAYPFKRSVNLYMAMPTEVNEHDATFTIDYDGTYPSKPILQAAFAGAEEGGEFSDDGDCGFVAFIDDDGSIIQLGNPDAIDIEEFTPATNLINKSFVNTQNWSKTGGHAYGNKAITGSITIRDFVDEYYNQGKGQRLKHACCVSYGSHSGWHGPILHKSIDATINFTLRATHRLCIADSKNMGSFEIGAYNVVDGAYTMVAGVVITKTSNGNKGTVRYIVDGEVVKTAKIDLSFNNRNFGFASRKKKYKRQYYTDAKMTKKSKGNKKTKYSKKVSDGYTYKQAKCLTTITKSNDVVTFKVGNLPKVRVKKDGIILLPVHDVSIHFGRKGTLTPIVYNGISSLTFTARSAEFEDIPNVFTANDVVEADCNTATVTLRKVVPETEETEGPIGETGEDVEPIGSFGDDEPTGATGATGEQEDDTDEIEYGALVDGEEVPQYGALGNQWEEFELHNGTNIITATWSDWVNPDFKPALRIIYNEVFL